MKHSGRARQAALKMIFLTLLALIAICAIPVLLAKFAILVAPALAALWIIFTLFTLYFFRDPEARTPSGAGVVVSPAHGKIDIIDQFDEPHFMGGKCQRISIFLSVIDIHVQNAPLAGKLACYRYNAGKFLSALKLESAAENENLLMGFNSP